MLDFKKKYTTKNLKENKPSEEIGKEEISPDGYALCEMIEELITIFRTKK